MLRDHLVFAHQLHAQADELGGKAVLGHLDALVIRHKIPPLHGVSRHGRGIGQRHVAANVNRRLFQADADELHAVIGFDHDLRHVGAGWDAADADDLLERFRALVAAVESIPDLCGWCWTQLTDVEQEINGLMTADRRPKVDPQLLLAALTRTR